MRTLYETTIINTGGREGIVYSEDQEFQLEVAKTKSSWRKSYDRYQS